MKIDYEQIGRRIARRRNTLGLRQAEVCDMCDISDKYLSGIERARSIPSIDVLLRICEALQTTPDALLLGTRPGGGEEKRAAVAERLYAMSDSQLRLLDGIITLLLEREGE